MKKLAIIAALISTSAFASDIQQVTTSEVYTQTEVVEQYYSTQTTPAPVLQPVAVHTGRTVTVRDHYDVYQPRIVYDKVGSFSTTKRCGYRCR